MGHRSRNWCFTLNNYTEHDIARLVDQYEFNYTYCIFGKEVGEQGTHHLQGYMEFANAKALTTLKKLNDRAHWEKRRGKQEQAIAYCKKDGNVTEIGTPKEDKPGKRNDLMEVKYLLNNGACMRDIVENYNYQCIRHAEKWLTYKETKRSSKPTVTWIWGKSGSGKTKMAYEMAPDSDNRYEKDNTKWWDGYDKQDTVILDDFRGTHMEFTSLLKLLDRYAYRVEFKGGFRQFDSPNIIITSINHPSKAYGFLNKEEPLEQLLRRIDNIVHVESDTEVDTKMESADSENNGSESHYEESSTDTEVGGNTKPRPKRAKARRSKKRRTIRYTNTAKSCLMAKRASPALPPSICPPDQEKKS
uniref:Replication-associated protein n=1 Tax=Cressdnaviricota sp. TaxID=2748378 RepID=A0A6M9Z7B5_9VIRU|nr:MAG: replication-associated protein [Cressdnaviricota sp.]